MSSDDLIELLRNEAQGNRDGHPTLDQALLDQAAAALEAAQKRIRELEDGLRWAEEVFLAMRLFIP